MTRTNVQLKGFAELERKLLTMPDKLAKRATNRAMRQASRLIADEMKSQAPLGPTGNLARSIKVEVRNRSQAGLSAFGSTLRTGGSIEEARGALRDARRGGGSGGSRVYASVVVTAPHAHLVEFGTVERFHKSGKSVGVMPQNPFIRRSWDMTRGDALAAIGRILTVEVDRASREAV